MKGRFTYKELSILVGILVAIIIWLTIRFTNPSLPHAPAATQLHPTTKKTSEVILQIIKKATTQIRI